MCLRTGSFESARTGSSAIGTAKSTLNRHANASAERSARCHRPNRSDLGGFVRHAGRAWEVVGGRTLLPLRSSHRSSSLSFGRRRVDRLPHDPLRLVHPQLSDLANAIPRWRELGQQLPLAATTRPLRPFALCSLPRQRRSVVTFSISGHAVQQLAGADKRLLSWPGAEAPRAIRRRVSTPFGRLNAACRSARGRWAESGSVKM